MKTEEVKVFGYFISLAVGTWCVVFSTLGVVSIHKESMLSFGFVNINNKSYLMWNLMVMLTTALALQSNLSFGKGCLRISCDFLVGSYGDVNHSFQSNFPFEKGSSSFFWLFSCVFHTCWKRLINLSSRSELRERKVHSIN